MRFRCGSSSDDDLPRWIIKKTLHICAHSQVDYFIIIFLMPTRIILAVSGSSGSPLWCSCHAAKPSPATHAPHFASPKNKSPVITCCACFLLFDRWHFSAMTYASLYNILAVASSYQPRLNSFISLRYTPYIRTYSIVIISAVPVMVSLASLSYINATANT